MVFYNTGGDRQVAIKGQNLKFRLEKSIMFITCLDLEGVLVPEIWVEFAEVTGIEELKKNHKR